jgi:hypothetical protein
MNVTCGVGGVCTGTWMLITDQSADCVAMVKAVVTFHLKKVRESARGSIKNGISLDGITKFPTKFSAKMPISDSFRRIPDSMML